MRGEVWSCRLVCGTRREKVPFRVSRRVTRHEGMVFLEGGCHCHFLLAAKVLFHGIFRSSVVRGPTLGSTQSCSLGHMLDTTYTGVISHFGNRNKSNISCSFRENSCQGTCTNCCGSNQAFLFSAGVMYVCCCVVVLSETKNVNSYVKN